MHTNDFIRREAVLTSTIQDGITLRGQYRWNTGEISQISVPNNFTFDPMNAVRPTSYSQSPIDPDIKSE